MGIISGRSFVRKLLSGVALIGALTLAACGGSTAAATPTATPSPTPTATLTPTPTPLLNATYASPGGLYSLQYPMAWSTLAINSSSVVNGVRLLSGDTNDAFFVLPLTQGIGTAQYASFLKGFLQGNGFNSTNIVVNPTAQTVPLNGVNWTSYDATAKLHGTVDYQTSIIGVEHNGKSFLVIAMAPAATSDTVGNTYFAPMLTSLKLLK